ncbi:hypothetical protein [Streptomyces sp. bgisy100]|uniref:hypothetical protein n=1 Tax=Streptomyces sp. bgisy100 TaxID=3413783 RepID=UPI003D7306E5
MTADPSDPENFEPGNDLSEFAIEAPDADTADQHLDVVPPDEDVPPQTDLEVDPADALEQSRVVHPGEDEDDYS